MATLVKTLGTSISEKESKIICYLFISTTGQRGSEIAKACRFGVNGLYVALKRMESKNLVISHQVPHSDSGPVPRYYRLTTLGQAIAEKIATLM